MSLAHSGRPSVTIGLAGWAVGLEPSAEDLALADRALLDTVAVGLAAREEPIQDIAAVLRRKVADCLAGIPVEPHDITWASAADLLRTHLTQRGD